MWPLLIASQEAAFLPIRGGRAANRDTFPVLGHPPGARDYPVPVQAPSYRSIFSPSRGRERIDNFDVLVIVHVAGMGVSRDVPDVCERTM